MTSSTASSPPIVAAPPVGPVTAEYPRSACAEQATRLVRESNELATKALKVIDDLLFTSDAREILQRKPANCAQAQQQQLQQPCTPRPPLALSEHSQEVLQREALRLLGKSGSSEDDKALCQNVRVEEETAGDDKRRSIKRLATFIMSQLATRPVDRATVSAMATGWNRRRSSTAISILSAIDVVRGMGVADGFKRLLVLNKNLVILSGYSKVLLAYYTAMKRAEQALNKQLDAMLSLFHAAHGLQHAKIAETPLSKRPRSSVVASTPVMPFKRRAVLVKAERPADDVFGFVPPMLPMAPPILSMIDPLQQRLAAVPDDMQPVLSWAQPPAPLCASLLTSATASQQPTSPATAETAAAHLS